MDELLKKQQELQKSLNNNYNPKNTGQLCHEIKEMAFYLNQEVVELIEEIAGSRDINKPWKAGHNDIYGKPIVITDKVKSEAIDVLKFCLNICIMSGITQDNLNEEFDKVHNRNIVRHKDGY